MLHQLECQGVRLVAAATRAGPDAMVPDCPGWRVRDLLHHIGTIHRWVTAVAVGGRAVAMAEFDAAVARPDDMVLASWSLAGLSGLVEALNGLTDDEPVWTLLPDPEPRRFWIRRQLHETAVHRIDAECAAGEPLTDWSTDAALDGIDELLTVLVPLPDSRLRTTVSRTLAVLPTDADVGWTLQLSDGPPVVTRTRSAADGQVTGSAAALFGWLWNRTVPGVEVGGDAELAALWRDRVQVRR